MPSKKNDEFDNSQTGEFQVRPAGEKTLRREERPPQAPEGKKIHPRRPLPSVPDKQEPATPDVEEAEPE